MQKEDFLDRKEIQFRIQQLFVLSGGIFYEVWEGSIDRYEAR